MLGPSLGAADKLRPPDIEIEGLYEPQLTMDGMRVICRVRVGNPNYVDLPVEDARLRLRLSDVPAARGRLPGGVTIPARTRKLVDLLVDVEPAATVHWLPLFMGDESFTVPFRVQGYVDVGRPELGRVHFDESGDVAMTEKGLVVTQPD